MPRKNVLVLFRGDGWCRDRPTTHHTVKCEDANGFFVKTEGLHQPLWLWMPLGRPVVDPNGDDVANVGDTAMVGVKRGQKRRGGGLTGFVHVALLSKMHGPRCDRVHLYDVVFIPVGVERM